MLALGSADYIGIAGVVTAFFSGLAALVGAIAATRANRAVTTPPGSPPLAELATNVAAAVTTPPDSPPLGELLDHVHEAVCNGKTGEVPVVPPEGAGPA